MSAATAATAATVLGKVSTLAVQETTLLCGVTLEVGFLKDELTRLQCILQDADRKWRPGNASVANWVSQTRDAAYEVENVIEAVEHMHKRNRLKKGYMGAISRYACLPSDLSTLHKVGVEIFVSAERLKIDLGNTTSIEKVHVGGEFPQNLEDDVVGFEDEYREIVDLLVDKDNMLSVVSIVAMGGAGKTTLARRVYTSSRVKQHFKAVAWVTVSQMFKAIDLLKVIIKQMLRSIDEKIDTMHEYDVGEKIRGFLSQKRYLVVLDDVWETNTWEQINTRVNVFPDENNGSRVLLTTRREDVANHIQMPTHVRALKPLDEEKSWQLFSSKALPSYKRSIICDVDEFVELGRKIAKKCNGLPLALAVLGGYLSKNLDKEEWPGILLDWPSTRNGQIEMMRDILARSYNDLENHNLRSCFLYLAAFPEAHEICVSDLDKIRIAECLIPHKPNHKPEETARKYVTELARSSLVQIVGRSRAHGWIEKIRIHDMLRDWCIEEARQNGFFDVIDKATGQASASSPNTMIFYRSSFQNFSGQILQATSKLRTLIGFGLSPVSLPKLRFLRVLHVENSSLKNLSRLISGCIHLRCLRLRRCTDVMLPSSIGQLLYLQTIDMRHTKLDSVVPTSLWDIPTLRHVYVSNAFSPPKDAQQKELETLELYIESDESDTKYFDDSMVTFLGQMTQLTTFILVFRGMPVGMINIFASMPYLVEISLNGFDVLDKLPESFPLSLQKIYLRASVIQQDPMPILEKLPCLVVLELQVYVGHTMSCSAGGFPRLQELQLIVFSTESRMEAGAMPKVSYLALGWCKGMSKLPQGLLHLPSLRYLKLSNMPQISGDDSTLKELQQKGCEVDNKNK